MSAIDPQQFHQFYGAKKPRVTYFAKDFVDYTVMTVLTGAVIYLCYGPRHWLTALGLALCIFMIAVFPIRHGVELCVPLILRRPQDLLYMVLYKVRNTKAVVLIAAAVLVLENLFIYWTPQLPHHTELMRRIALYLFAAHFILITLYRTAVLYAHLAKRESVRELLLQTSWKKYLANQPSIELHILHAYATGLLTHIVLIAPWYLVISYAKFSLLALPVTLVVNVILQYQFFKVLNAWFYRDHWLGHNSEFEFLYLHGTHHDAIPSGLIGVAGNGHLEGFLRYSVAFPTQFFNPIVTCLLLTVVVKEDIDTHQYVPGVFPKRTRQFHELTQHSTHHFGRPEPYSLGVKTTQVGLSAEARSAVRSLTRGLPVELHNSIELDEQLTGFQWANPAHKQFLELFDKYQKEGEP
jgi:hypothetical protein